MKTLIINGSPRINGDTAFLLSEFKKHINHEIIEIRVFDKKIKIRSCNDCRMCKEQKGCVIKDDMELIYNDDFNNVLIASPLYMSNLTPPLISLASRFQAYYCAARFLRDKIKISEKKAGLILVGGGDGGPKPAENMSKIIFKYLNAKGFEEHTALSLKTDDIPASADEQAIEMSRKIALYFNNS
ncbi:MAG: flavodoxin family protein [Oscillospiraceae bacterium]|nr:flavodoxin family protein [Oscillospiraceae bacterium]